MQKQQNAQFSPPVSQHFLTNRQLLRRIVSLSSIQKNDMVLEIGTGKGHLADELAGRCKTLCTIEIDRKLFGQAQRRLQAHANIDLHCGDFLRSPLPKHTSYKVFANIPFSITTQIIRKLTETCHPPTDMWLVMDKGAAKCCLGKPRETQRSLLLKPNWDLRIVYHFRKEDFHPNPSVDSVLVHFSRKRQPDIQPNQWKQYEHFVQHGLRYGFGGRKSLLSKKQVSRALQSSGYPPDYPDSLMLYVQWLCLFRCWHRK